MGPTSREDLPQKEQVVTRRPRNPPPPPPEPPPGWPGLLGLPELPGGCWPPPLLPPLPEPVPPPLPVRLLLAMIEKLAFPLSGRRGWSAPHTGTNAASR